MSKLTHLDETGAARMVDVSAKPVTEREARAEATIVVSPAAFEAIGSAHAPKGDVLAAARLAGIMGAKKTAELIPLCHTLQLSKAEVAFEMLEPQHAVRILSTVKTTAQTGVEMEALTAVSLAALTVYDMIKAVDREARIENVRLLAKSGGASGVYEAKPPRSVSRPPPVRLRASAKPLLATAPDSARRPKSVDEREAFRAFMQERRLRATEWAKQAGIAPSVIYAYLTGRSRALPQDAAKRLAQVARVGVDEMFR